MKSKTVVFLLLALGLALSACSPAGSGQTVRLSLGESARLDAIAAEVSFLELIEESRCPADVICIWAGRARVRIQVVQGEQSADYVLTLGEVLEEDRGSIQLDDFSITLQAVEPYPLESDPAEPEDYEITLELSVK